MLGKEHCQSLEVILDYVGWDLHKIHDIYRTITLNKKDNMIKKACSNIYFCIGRYFNLDFALLRTGNSAICTTS